jgi:ribosomal protein L44E
MVTKSNTYKNRNLLCDECKKITSHRVKYARLDAGSKRVKEQPVKAECLECGHIRRDMHNLPT